MSSEIITHFQKADPILFDVWQQLATAGHEFPVVASRPTDELFIDMCESIVGQQLSTKAANTIRDRFVTLFTDHLINPTELLALPDESIRAVGLSWSKIKYVKNVATATLAGDITWQQFPTMSNEAITSQLIAIKGIGQWTVEMFLMFGLGRPDVFSAGDLGLKNAIQRWYQLDISARTELAKLTAAWSPYQTYAARLLWKSLELPKSQE